MDRPEGVMEQFKKLVLEDFDALVEEDFDKMVANALAKAHDIIISHLKVELKNSPDLSFVKVYEYILVIAVLHGLHQDFSPDTRNNNQTITKGRILCRLEDFLHWLTEIKKEEDNG